MDSPSTAPRGCACQDGEPAAEPPRASERPPSRCASPLCRPRQLAHPAAWRAECARRTAATAPTHDAACVCAPIAVRLALARLTGWCCGGGEQGRRGEVGGRTWEAGSRAGGHLGLLTSHATNYPTCSPWPPAPLHVVLTSCHGPSVGTPPLTFPPPPASCHPPQLDHPPPPPLPDPLLPLLCARPCPLTSRIRSPLRGGNDGVTGGDVGDCPVHAGTALRESRRRRCSPHHRPRHRRYLRRRRGWHVGRRGGRVTVTAVTEVATAAAPVAAAVSSE